jgi:DNA-binding transcriptional LysR family regulator
MTQIESRPLRYFVAVAQELNFARAAERLGIAGPPLSRAIAQLETQLGVRLLERSTRRVELTQAGAVLLEQAQIALDALDAAARRAQRAGAPRHRLVLTLKADVDGGLLEETLAAYEREHAAVPLQVVLCGWGEQAQLLRDGRADVALVYDPYEPLDEPEIDHEPLLREPLVAALPAGHPLATRAAPLRVADFEATHRRTAGSLLWRPRDAADEARPRDIAQVLGLVELGQLLAFLPESVARRYQRPQLVFRPVVDAPLATLSVAWPRTSRSLATAAFVRVVMAVAERAAAGAATAERSRGR